MEKARRRLSVFPVLLVFIAILGLLVAQPTTANAAQVASGNCGPGNSNSVTWSLEDTGVLTLSGSGVTANYTGNDTPWYSPTTRRNSITSVVVSSGITGLGNYLFYNCGNLTSATIPASVTSIGTSTFNYAGLTTATISGNVSAIGAQAFYNCEDLTRITFEGASPPSSIGTDAFAGINASGTVYCLESARAAYAGVLTTLGLTGGALNWTLAYNDDVTPTLGDGTATRANDGAVSVSFAGSEAGTYYWQFDGTTPTAAALVAGAGNPSAALLSGTNIRNFTGLSTSAHTLYVAARDASGNVSNLLTIAVPAHTPPNSVIDVTGVTLSISTLRLTEGASRRLIAAISPEDASDTGMTWSSDDTDVVTVDTDGTVVAMRAGTATVTVETSDGGFTDSCEVTVVAADASSNPPVIEEPVPQEPDTIEDPAPKNSGSSNTLPAAGDKNGTIVLLAGIGALLGLGALAAFSLVAASNKTSSASFRRHRRHRHRD